MLQSSMMIRFTLCRAARNEFSASTDRPHSLWELPMANAECTVVPFNAAAAMPVDGQATYALWMECF